MPKFRPVSLMALVTALVLALVGCFEGDPEFSESEQVPEDVREAEEGGEGGEGEGEGDAEDVATVTFVAVDIDFEEAPTEVPAGEVEFELQNNGNAEHNVVLDDLGDELVVEAPGGETATGTVTLEPGEYRYHCGIPGHEQTMNGTLTVTE